MKHTTLLALATTALLAGRAWAQPLELVHPEVPKPLELHAPPVAQFHTGTQSTTTVSYDLHNFQWEQIMGPGGILEWVPKATGTLHFKLKTADGDVAYPITADATLKARPSVDVIQFGQKLVTAVQTPFGDIRFYWGEETPWQYMAGIQGLRSYYPVALAATCIPKDSFYAGCYPSSGRLLLAYRKVIPDDTVVLAEIELDNRDPANPTASVIGEPREYAFPGLRAMALASGFPSTVDVAGPPPSDIRDVAESIPTLICSTDLVIYVARLLRGTVWIDTVSFLELQDPWKQSPWQLRARTHYDFRDDGAWHADNESILLLAMGPQWPWDVRGSVLRTFVLPVSELAPDSTGQLNDYLAQGSDSVGFAELPMSTVASINGQTMVLYDPGPGSSPVLDPVGWEHLEPSFACPGESVVTGELDSDGDGLLDCWETDGLKDESGAVVLNLQTLDADLEALGVTVLRSNPAGGPLIPDIYLWFETTIDYTTPDPTLYAPDIVPLYNLWGIFAQRGIRLHLYVNNAIRIDAALYEPCADADYEAHHDNCVADFIYKYGFNVTGWLRPYAAARSVFRSVLYVPQAYGHQVDGRPHYASVGSEAKYIALTMLGGKSPMEETRTLMHELGHTLGLHHGGSDDLNYKPNYPSVMNYYGLHSQIGPPDPDVDGIDLSWYDYSDGSLPALDENSLIEADGIGNMWTTWFCPLVNPLNATQLTDFVQTCVDWSCSGICVGPPFPSDVNNDGHKGELVDHNDWGNLRFDYSRFGSHFPVEPFAQALSYEKTLDQVLEELGYDCVSDSQPAEVTTSDVVESICVAQPELTVVEPPAISDSCADELIHWKVEVLDGPAAQIGRMWQDESPELPEGTYVLQWSVIDVDLYVTTALQSVTLIASEEACCELADETFEGTEAADFWVSPGGSACYLGKGGGDFIMGSVADDVLVGGPGGDFIMGGGGDDLLLGSDGGDHLVGSAGGRVTMLGGAGEDALHAETASEARLRGGPGTDHVVGTAGEDVLVPGEEALEGDDVYGEGADDVIWIPATIVGGCQSVINGGAGHDVVYSPLTQQELQAAGVQLVSVEEFVLVSPSEADAVLRDLLSD